MIKSGNIGLYKFITYALFFAIVKPYFIPTVPRQIVKIAILFGIFLFIVSRSNFKQLRNLSLIFSACVILSGICNVLTDSYGMKDFFDSILYTITFFDTYSFFALCNKKRKTRVLIESLFQINLLYCILTLISVTIVGTENNSNMSVYPFGNKFTSCYLFVLFITLYGLSHEMDRFGARVIHRCIIVFSCLFSLYVGCSTGTVIFTALFLISFLPEKGRNILTNKVVVCAALVLSAVIIIWIELILKIDFVNQIVVDFFHKSTTVNGRLVIYSAYLEQLIRDNLWLGYGYSNDVMLTISKGVFGNTQNGLMEILMNYGIVGVVALIFTVYSCFKGSKDQTKAFYASFVVYGMIIAAVFEVTINWFFIMGIFLVRWCCNKTEEKTECTVVQSLTRGCERKL